jgi:hypothetical protein
MRYVIGKLNVTCIVGKEVVRMSGGLTGSESSSFGMFSVGYVAHRDFTSNGTTK